MAVSVFVTLALVSKGTFNITKSTAASDVFWDESLFIILSHWFLVPFSAQNASLDAA